MPRDVKSKSKGSVRGVDPVVVVASRQAARVRARRVSVDDFVVALRTGATTSAMERFLWNR